MVPARNNIAEHPAAHSSAFFHDEHHAAPGTHAAAGIQLSSSAQRDLLALHALRQRQLRTAFLYGTRRSWRDRRRIWPAVLVGLTLVGLAIAVISAVAAFR